MDLREALDERISCRAYSDRAIGQGTLDLLQSFIDDIDTSTGLRFQLFGPRIGEEGEPTGAIDMNTKLFAGTVYHYAALVGPDDELTREKVGYRDGVLSALVRKVERGREIEDLGIAKLRFEIGSGNRGTWEWGNGGRFVLS